MPDDGEILGCIVFSNTTMVFIEGNIQLPMQAVFNSPMVSSCPEDLFGIILQAGDKVTGLFFQFSLQ